MIIRVPHRRQFTIIADGALRDPRLSFRATGVLAYLLSLPDGSQVSGRRLTTVKSEGRDAILRALDELETAGYLCRDKVQNLVDGRWTTAVTVLELPPGNLPPSPEKPNPGDPDPDNQDLTAFSTSSNTKEPSPGNPTPKWADQELWQDEKNRWHVGSRPDDEKAS